MGKRKSRSRDASPASKRSSKLTERVKHDGHSTPEVVVSPRTPVSKRVSAFSRYAKEKPTPDKEDSSQAETPKRNRRQSSSPQTERKKKRKGKRQQQVDEADEAESSDNVENTPKKPKEVREANQNEVTNADTSEDVDPNNGSRSDPDAAKRDETQKGSEHDVQGATAKIVKEGASVSGHSSVDEGRQNSDYSNRNDHDQRQERRHDQGDRYDRSPRFDRESSRDRPRDGRWVSPQHQHQRSDNQDKRRHHSPEKKAPNIKTFPVGDSVIVVAKHPETLSLWGCASVRSLLNNVDVCGFILRQGAAAIDIFSTSSTSFVTIATTLPSNTPHSDIKKTLDDINGLEKSTKKDILSVVDSESTVLVFAETVGKLRLDFITNVPPFQQIFWSKENEEAGRRFLQLGSLPVAVALDPGVKQIRISHEMKKASEQFCSSIQKGETPTIAVCGGKNVGKSTMGRYLTNCALNKCPQVAYLECDVGQTEYSPPGCVSLHLISDPVLGPPFTHQRRAHKMLYFGAVTPSDDPQYYLSCVKAAYAAYTSLPHPCPLVVNTMGWNEGLGLILLASTVSITHPKYVVQFESNNRNRNLPPVTPQFVTEQERWPTMREDAEERTPTHDLFTIKSLVDSGEFRDRYHPADHRMLSLLGYLCRFQDPSGPCLPLHALHPQTVPWGSVAVHVSHAAVPNSQVMYALNASIVGLCRVQEEMLLSSDDDSLPKFLSEKPVCECIGFGIVRSIDPENKVFQIVTDLTLDSNTGINCLLRGCLDVPQSLIASQGLKEFESFSLNPQQVNKHNTQYKPAGRKKPKQPNRPKQAGPNRGNNRGGSNRGGHRVSGNRGDCEVGGNRGGREVGGNRGGHGVGGNRGGREVGGNRGGHGVGGNRGGHGVGGNRGGREVGGNRGGHGVGGNRGGREVGGNRGGHGVGGNRGGHGVGGNRGGREVGGNRGGHGVGGNRGGHGVGGNRGGHGVGGNRGGHGGDGNRGGREVGGNRGGREVGGNQDGRGSNRSSGRGGNRGSNQGQGGKCTAKLAWGEETKIKEHTPKTFGHRHSRS